MVALNDEERIALLALARESIAGALSEDETTPGADLAPSPALCRQCAVFVTLQQTTSEAEPRQLRGCIGSIDPLHPLQRAVCEMARKAAFEDPRFSPLSLSELHGIRIEISVLGPLEPLARIADLEVGRDGVDLRSGSARAVFLPQVGSERGWSREELLEQLSAKAGLGRHGWRDAELRVFRAEVFGEPV